MPSQPPLPPVRPVRRALWIGGACALAVLAIWTSFILVARSSARHSLLPLDIAFLRFLFSGVLALPLAWWWGAQRLRAELGGAAALKRVAALALFAGMGYCSLAYSGFFFAPAAHAAVLLPGSLPMWTALFAAWLLRERLTRGRVAGLLLIASGDVLVGGSSLLQAFDGSGTWRGDLLFLSASACWGAYSVLCRRWQVGAVPATVAIALGCLFSFVPLYGLGLWTGAVPTGLPQAPWREIVFQAVYQGGLAMLVAGLAFTQVITTFGPVRTTMLTAMVPVLAALAAVPLLGEPLNAAALGGLACVTGGLLLGLWAAKPPALPAPRLAGKV